MIKSFSDLPRDQLLAGYKTAFVPWETSSVRDQIMAQATETLSKWLEASLRTLHAEGVNSDDLQIVHRGGRTVIRVGGVDRFEFKMKFSYGACGDG